MSGIREPNDSTSTRRRRTPAAALAIALLVFGATGVGACGDEYGAKTVVASPDPEHAPQHGGQIYTLGPTKEFAHIEIVHAPDEGRLRTFFTGPDAMEPVTAGDYVPVEVKLPESTLQLELRPVEFEGRPARTVYEVVHDGLKGLRWFQLTVNAVSLRGENISTKTFKFRH